MFRALTRPRRTCRRSSSAADSVPTRRRALALADVLERDTALVVDADALNLLAAEADLGERAAAAPRAARC